MLIRVLGSIEASNGEKIALRGATHRRLIASLALNSGEVVSLDRLVEITWPDGDVPAQAERNVRTYVHRLRGALGPDLADRIETVEPGYRIHLEPGELDAERFDELASRAGRVGSAGDPAGAIELVDEAVGLWRGQPLGEFADESWAQPAVERLAEIHVRLRELRAESLISVGRAGEAVTDLEELVRELPLRERPRGLLMQALYDDGRQVDALRLFHEFRRVLIDEIGVEPTAELVALDRAIASGDSELLRQEPRARTIGAYELHDQVGEGMFSVVYRGTQTGLGRDVAIKAIRAELANRPEFIRRFEAEAQMVAGLEHPHIVPLHDFWREPDTAYLVMRWLPGGTLQSSLADGAWSLSRTVRMVEQVGSGLGFAHRAGVVHRDVNPANIMLDVDGNAFLTDFGIAIEADEGPAVDIRGLADVARQALTADESEDHRARPRIVPETLREVLARATEDNGSEFSDVAVFVDAFVTAAGLSESRVLAAVPGQSSNRIGQGVGSVDADNPYKGLRAFDEGDAERFFGRERLTQELVDRLGGDNRGGGRLVAVVGPSGSGKSSVVRAGLLPAVRRGAISGSERWFVTTMNPGTHPFEQLETALLRVAVNPPASLLDQLTDGPRGIVRGVRRVLPDDSSPLLVVIDQFEELFTLCADETVRGAFLESLAVAASAPDSPVRIVVTLRADFYDRPLRHPEFAALMKQNSVTVTPLSGDELEAAIVAPAASVGVDFEPGLVAQIVADVASQAGALPLLQYAMTELFQTRGSGHMLLDDYRTHGGITGALARRAEELYDRGTSPQQAAIRALFGRLVTLGEGSEDTRRRIRVSELADNSETDAAISDYGSARLLTFDRDPHSREPTVEVAHEALIREWPRLREWLDDDRQGLRVHRHLTVSAAAWADRGRDDGELYRGVRLDAAQDWVAAGRPSLNLTEKGFLDASAASREAEELAERNRVRRLRRLLVLTGVVAVVALIAGALALRQQQRADDQAALAEQNAELANTNAGDASESAALADQRADEAERATAQGDLERLRAVAIAIAPDSPAVAGLLAVEVYRNAPSVENLDLLHRVLTALPQGFQGSIPGGPYWGAELLADGTTMAAVGTDSVDVWDLDRREMIRSISHSSVPGTAAIDVTDDGRFAAVRGEREETFLFDLTDGAVLGRLQHETAINDVSLSITGRRLAAARVDGKVEVWDLASLALTTLLDTGSDAVRFARWSPVEDRLAVITERSGVQFWDPSTDAPLWTWTSDSTVDRAAIVERPNSLLFGSDGQRLVVDSGSFAAELTVLLTSDGAQVFEPTPKPSTAAEVPLDALWWIDEEASIVAAVSAGNVRAFHLSTGEAGDLIVRRRLSNDIVFSPLLNQVVTVNSSGIALWSTDGSGPLERVVPLPDEQRKALASFGGNVHTSLSADGSQLFTSVIALPAIAPSVVFDLTERTPKPNVFTTEDFLAPVTTGYGGYTLLAARAGVQLIDGDNAPLGRPVPLPFDLSDIAASPDGRFFALSRLGGFVDLYTGSGELLENLSLGDLEPGEGAIVSPSFSESGDLLAATTSEGRMAIWSTDTLERLPLETQVDWEWARLAGEWLMVRRSDASLVRIDPGTSEQIGEPFLSTPGGYFAWDPTQSRMAVNAGVVKVFDLETGQQLGRELANRPYNIEFAADGKTLSVPGDDRVTLWNFDTDTWADIACEMAGRNLTAEEWEQLGPRTIERRATCPQYPLD